MSSEQVPERKKPPDNADVRVAALLAIALELTHRWGRSLAFVALVTVSGLIAAGMAHTDVQALAIVGMAVFAILVALVLTFTGRD